MYQTKSTVQYNINTDRYVVRYQKKKCYYKYKHNNE